VCSKNDKKTINAEHIEAALHVNNAFTQNLGLQEQIPEMKEMTVLLKEQNQVCFYFIFSKSNSLDRESNKILKRT